MKLTVMQSDLEKALKAVSPAVASRPTLPVLSHVLLETDEVGALHLAGTDLELRIDTYVIAQIDEAGSFSVPAKLFSDLVGSFQDERIHLELKGAALCVECAGIAADVKGIDAQEYPLSPPVLSTDADPVATFDAKEFRDAIDKVVFAAADDESRPILTGIHILAAQGEGEPFTFAAADGYRLAVCKAGQASAPLQATIPAKALFQAARLSSDSEGPISLYLDRNQVRFEIPGKADVTSQLIEGHYVNYNQIIPESHATRTLVDRIELLHALKSAHPFSRTEADIVHFSISEYGDSSKLTVTATGSETGEYRAELAVEVDGNPLDVIAFNSRYLVDVLSALDSKQVALETTNASRPGVIKPVDQGDSYVHVIMPMASRQ